ncbi:MAG TPA: peptide deformylase [Bacteroidales bacterium]|nr:MAG: peptide deformylase [Bacteroidetes bacterium GWE2_42_24]OFY31641.1 MAG: peptide deformylase [Bacteroidetes bacterium GWF2_43_11]HAQ64448.1 peptide deformylase [Bacteroidales bacterium]HBZ67102.1 peptide deformylase [Bacteroidales bacterium]
MILPIVAYGHPILRKKAIDITPGEAGIGQFITDLWETMYATDGVGLAAPQVNRSIRIFVIDGNPLSEKYPEAKNFRQCFINARIIEEEGEPWGYSEGCLSIPEIHESVERKPRVHIQYLDEQFQPHDEWFEGANARVIQHEYDHLEGILFTDLLSTLRKTMLRRKLSDISHGNIKIDYRMIFPINKKRK